MKISNITLEMTLKPFRSMEEDFIREICQEIFTQWHALLRHGETISVLLWTADGSEILEYRGDMDESIEWARYLLSANPKHTAESGPVLYMSNPPQVTCRDIARIVTTLKEEGRAITGKSVRVGTTFDPGPEFVESPFKYERHPEICLGRSMGPDYPGFATCYARLNEENRQYAGFPDGIPQDTPLGTFLGRQCQNFMADLDFDFIWLSNGFGFGRETWHTTGQTFDGERFYSEKSREIAKKTLGFWESFRAECPDYRIETRGTNFSTGIDLSSDAVPTSDIYKGGFNLAPPPNSPWAAINGDFGLEMVGYMSRICELPDEKDGFPFRLYIHDPWWLNSPWLDRYGSEPHDIYLPLSVGRIDSHGNTTNPSSLEFLTIDDSYGQMPVAQPCCFHGWFRPPTKTLSV